MKTKLSTEALDGAASAVATMVLDEAADPARQVLFDAIKTIFGRNATDLEISSFLDEIEPGMHEYLHGYISSFIRHRMHRLLE